MLYNSFTFLLFFPIVVILFFVLPHKARQIYLLVTSYLFYMNWSPTYGLFLAYITLASYAGALMLDKSSTYGGDKIFQYNKIILISMLILCLSGLFIFKYIDFLNKSEQPKVSG